MFLNKKDGGKRRKKELVTFFKGGFFTTLAAICMFSIFTKKFFYKIFLQKEVGLLDLNLHVDEQPIIKKFEGLNLITWKFELMFWKAQKQMLLQTHLLTDLISLEVGTPWMLNRYNFYKRMYCNFFF